MKTLNILLLLVVFLFISSKVAACSCEHYNGLDLRQYNGYDLIYKGEVLGVIEKREKWEKVIKFSIKKVYKGKTETDTVSLKTGLDEASCGLNFKEGQTWMIFASDNKGNYYTGLCTRSKLLNGNPAKQLKFIRDKKFVNKYSSFNGTVSSKDAKGELRDGKVFGQWTYYKNGKIWEIKRYSERGDLHGNSEVYYEEGPLHYSTEYSNGKYIRSIYYNKDGAVDRVYEKN